MPVFSPRPPAERARRRSLIDVALDPAQKEAVERPPGGAMLVLGEAGHGKTTVALHRLAHLYAKSVGRFRAVVLVPTEGLCRLLQPLVTRLGADVNVVTYEEWARKQARRAFGDLPRRESNAASVGVARIKRDPALRPLLAEMAARAPGVIDDDEDAPPPDTHALAHRGDLQHLFGDSTNMDRVARESAQGITAHAVAEILEHTHVQFTRRSEVANAHVDAERLVTVDALSLDAGTPNENAEAVDVEDYAVLFELDRLRAAHQKIRPTSPRKLDCIVLDEAQELAPLELALVGRSLAPGGTLVVAGDADQQVDPSTCFLGWKSTMRELDAESHETVLLEVGYRCPPTVAELARSLRAGGEATASRVPMLRFETEQELAIWIAAEAEHLDQIDPTGTMCVVTRSPLFARRLAGALAGRVPLRLVLDGEFVFHRGLDVTTVDQVKGLEFDYVIADASLRDFPDTADSRRALYVATTRARHEVALVSIGNAMLD
ncbi:MAG: ATP-binding domain-containing protein [Polyangiaceae bacterium]